MFNNNRPFIVDRNIIFTLFILSPIFSVINLPGKYTVISALFLIAFWYYFHFKELRNIVLSYPLIIWLILTIYHWINAIQKKVPEVDYLDLLHGLKIYSCLAIFTFLARKNFDQTIRSLFNCFGIYLVMSFFINDTSSEELSGRLTGVIYATALGQTAALSGIYIAYYSIRNNISVLKTVLFYSLPILVILLTQSRNSLVMIVIGIIGHSLALALKKRLNMRKIIFTILILAITSLWSFDLVIKNTDIGKRISETESVKKSQEVNNLTTGTYFDNIVGDRLVYYVRGFEFFKDSPLTGIGMWNYEYVSKGNFPLHTEYMVHLSEGGVIAASLWLLFILSVFKGVRKSNIPKHIRIIAIFSIIEILFCGIYARVFYYEFFYPVIGIALSFSSWGYPKVKNRLQHI